MTTSLHWDSMEANLEADAAGEGKGLTISRISRFAAPESFGGVGEFISCALCFALKNVNKGAIIQ
jgi:hypothetical protein